MWQTLILHYNSLLYWLYVFVIEHPYILPKIANKKALKSEGCFYNKDVEINYFTLMSCTLNINVLFGGIGPIPCAP